VFSAVNVALLGLFTIVILFPVLYVLKRSFDVGAQGELVLSLIPREFSFFYYKVVVTDASIYRPFLNSIILTVVGTVIQVSLEAMGAYPLSRKELPGNRFFIYMIVITMMFSGGMVPLYLVVRGLHLIDKFPWVLILPFCMSAWNLILYRNYYFTVPSSLRESALMDGAGELTIFVSVIVPLSMPVIAALGLFTGVNFWNAFFSAVIFINSPTKYTFALKLREILALQMEMNNRFERIMSPDMALKNLNIEGMYSAIIILSMVPIIVAYPFLQRHFVKGILVGSIKG
jgi:ABC-type glycerol-3-phosphate transport system permease component